MLAAGHTQAFPDGCQLPAQSSQLISLFHICIALPTASACNVYALCTKSVVAGKCCAGMRPYLSASHSKKSKLRALGIDLACSLRDCASKPMRAVLYPWMPKIEGKTPFSIQMASPRS